MQGIDGGRLPMREASDPIEPAALDGRPSPSAAEPSRTTPQASGPVAPAQVDRHCPWCSATAPAGAVRCPSCGAALIESEAIGSSGIPGVTSVDPGVRADEEAARRQLKRQARGSHALGATLGFVGVPFGRVIGSAIEDLVAARAGGPSGDANKMGIMDLLDLERTPRAEDVATAADAQAASSAQLADPWVDLPPPALEDQIAGTEFDPWVVRDQSAGGAFDPWADQGGQATQAGRAGAMPAANVLSSPGVAPDGGSVADPWSFENGPWSQDPWGTRDDGPGSDPSKRR